jgi:hypothetical protein
MFERVADEGIADPDAEESEGDPELGFVPAFKNQDGAQNEEDRRP